MGLLSTQLSLHFLSKTFSLSFYFSLVFHYYSLCFLSPFSDSIWPLLSTYTLSFWLLCICSIFCYFFSPHSTFSLFFTSLFSHLIFSYFHLSLSDYLILLSHSILFLLSYSPFSLLPFITFTFDLSLGFMPWF